MTSEEMLFYAKFTELVRLCLDEERMEHSSWNPYRREIVETLLKTALLALCNAFTTEVADVAKTILRLMIYSTDSW